MKKINVSVREVAEFLFGSGSIVNERILQTRAQEGLEIHTFWQNQYLNTDKKEVVVKTTVLSSNIELNIQGRIDGVIYRDEVLYIEEIKSTHADFDILDESTYPAHMAQAKLYAYMYMTEHNLKSIDVLLTYIQVSDRKTLQFEKHYSRSQIKKYFDRNIQKYLDWLELLNNHESERLKSIEGLTFPFKDFRLNQRQMMAYIYKNVLRKGSLYCEAPTGIGKTIASLFSSLKAINQPRQKIFYTTAKNDGKKVVIDTVKLLEEKGLVAKTCELTAKDSMCLLKERDCDPEVCKYANGYYKRVYKAINDIFKNESLVTKETFTEYGKKHKVCPFELSLDTSNYCDIIICDYNYVFDPLVKLIRYFEMDTYTPIVLVDEAHNLVSRSRAMYSASLLGQEFKRIKETAKYLKPNPKYELNQIIDLYEEFSIELLEVDFIKKEEVNPYFIKIIKKLMNKLDQIFSDDNIKFDKKALREFYFNLVRFTKIYEYYDEDFVFLIEKVDDDILASIKCLNASKFIDQTVKLHTDGITFFSATLEPMFYYKSLITNTSDDDISFHSGFKQENLLLLSVDNVSTRYKDRENSIDRIVEVTKSLISPKKGNYILFFPSYAYMNQVKEILEFEIENVNFITQRREMFSNERTDMINLFKESSDKTQVFMFVMGGIFGESIDLIGDMLSGVLIVGTALPAISSFNNVLRSHYDYSFRNGFDYAYTYPGINKVIQAVGRVIRTETDRGIAILLDDRFTTRKYLKLYPDSWSHLQVCNDTRELSFLIKDFWEGGNDEETN